MENKRDSIHPESAPEPKAELYPEPKPAQYPDPQPDASDRRKSPLRPILWAVGAAAVLLAVFLVLRHMNGQPAETVPASAETAGEGETASALRWNVLLHDLDDDASIRLEAFDGDDNRVEVLDIGLGDAPSASRAINEFDSAAGESGVWYRLIAAAENGETTYTRTPTQTLQIQKDEAGRRVAESTRSQDGSGDADFSFAYDESGRLISAEEQYSYDTLRMTYAYDEAGQLVSERVQSNAGTYTNLFEYDENGCCVLERRVDASGAEQRRVVNTFDARGNRVSAAYYDASGDLTGSMTLSYDVQDRVVQIVWAQTANGEPVWTRDMSYDSNGVLLQLKNTDASGAVTVLDLENAVYQPAD